MLHCWTKLRQEGEWNKDPTILIPTLEQKESACFQNASSMHRECLRFEKQSHKKPQHQRVRLEIRNGLALKQKIAGLALPVACRDGVVRGYEVQNVFRNLCHTEITQF